MSTGIEWTDETWNPIRGCSRVSAGCQRCYAETTAGRFAGPGQPYEGLVKRVGAEWRWTGEVRVVEKHLMDPLRWRTPRRVFVNSMSDLFHERVSDDDLDRIFAVMALAPQHVFQVLTKRPARMQAYMRAVRDGHRPLCAVASAIRGSFVGGLMVGQAHGALALNADGTPNQHQRPPYRPFPNVWLGVSCENQEALDERVPLLLETPAAVRFISAEPLLGPINFTRWLNASQGRNGRDSVPGRSSRLAGGPARRLDLASPTTTQSPLGEDHGAGGGTSPSGRHSGQGVSQGQADAEPQPGELSGAQVGLENPQGADSSGADHQSHQRRQSGQPARELGTGDAFRANPTRGACPASGTDGEPARGAEPRSQVGLGGCGGDSTKTGERGGAEEHRCGLRSDGQNDQQDRTRPTLDLIIVGGESGPQARPCAVEWVRSVVRQCQAAGVSVFVKQLGSFVTWDGTQGGYGDGPSNCWPGGRARTEPLGTGGWRQRLHDRKGGDPEEWPVDLRVREMPRAYQEDS